MSMLPILEITLERGLSKESTAQTINTINSISGVFNAVAPQDGKRKLYLTVSTDANILRNIRKIDGVQKARYYPIM